MTNQQIMDHGNQMMDETDQAIERGKKVATDKCIMGLLFLIVIGVMAIIIVKTILFGVGRYLSRMTSFEIEPPTNKLSFGWPSHVLRSVGAERILKEFLCLKHVHEQLRFA